MVAALHMDGCVADETLCCFLDACVRVVQLTAFVNIRRDVDGRGVV